MALILAGIETMAAEVLDTFDFEDTEELLFAAEHGVSAADGMDERDDRISAYLYLFGPRLSCADDGQFLEAGNCAFQLLFGLGEDIHGGHGVPSDLTALAIAGDWIPKLLELVCSCIQGSPICRGMASEVWNVIT